jgi:hypothetical protein
MKTALDDGDWIESWLRKWYLGGQMYSSLDPQMSMPYWTLARSVSHRATKSIHYQLRTSP